MIYCYQESHIITEVPSKGREREALLNKIQNFKQHGSLRSGVENDCSLLTSKSKINSTTEKIEIEKCTNMGMIVLTLYNNIFSHSTFCSS